MGFYDCRCMITGVSLHGSDATLVALRQAGNGYQPIALGMTGTYDRAGSIDGITEDTNTDLLLTYFLDRLRDGRFFVDTERLVIDADRPITDLDDLVWCLERNCLCYYPDTDPFVLLDGALVYFALIAQPVWAALAATVAPSRESVELRFERLFGEDPAAGEIYRGRRPEVTEQVRQLSGVSDFLATRGQAWAPPAETAQPYPQDMGAQHSPEDIRGFLDEAKRDFDNVAPIQAALRRYEQDVRGRDLLD